MANSRFITCIVFFLLLAFQTNSAICQSVQSSMPKDGERLAVLPFEVRGLDEEKGKQLRQEFSDVLAQSNRFDIMSDNVVRNNLALAGLTKIDSCNTLPCLAQLGRVLNVEKVIHIKVDQWQERFVLDIRLVRTVDAALLYAERVEYSGEFQNLRSTVIPEQARKLSTAYLDKKPNWYLIAAAVIAGVGLIYWIYSSFSSSSSSESETGGSTPAPH